jgi:phytoene synthase
VCEAITREQAKNFYYGLRTTPRAKRDALYAIYAWMRILDDLVDEPGTRHAGAGQHQTTDAYVEASRALLRAGAGAQACGQIAPHDGGTIWPALAHAIATQPIEPAWLELMIEGVLADQFPRQPATMEELAWYCHRVGGTVGLCCTSVWAGGSVLGMSMRDALAKADARGRGFQIINILRDIATDALLRPARWYVPASVLAKHRLSREGLLAWSDTKACEAVVRELAGEARAQLDASRGLERALQPDCGAALWTMTRIYTGVLARLEATPRLCVGASPVRVPRPVKLGYALAGAVLPRVVVRMGAFA